MGYWCPRINGEPRSGDIPAHSRRRLSSSVKEGTPPPRARSFDMSASVKYWYLSRISSGVSMNSTATGFPRASNTARTKSRKVRAFPEPRLKDAARFPVFHHEPERVDDVFNIDEIAKLLAIFIGGVVGNGKASPGRFPRSAGRHDRPPRPCGPCGIRSARRH